MAQVTRSEMCAHCKACDFGKKETHLIALPEGDFAAGDIVELTIPEGSVGLGSLLAYGIPLIMLLAGLGVAALLRLSELLQALFALLFACGGFFITRALDKRLSRKSAFRVTVRKVEPPFSAKN
jgi:positive regulator of sigma E activity